VRVGRDWIAAHIPHQAAMCLLDGVLEWDEQHIVCRTRSHRDLANPLRVAGSLPAACGIEYAAQAMAVHGALLDAHGTPLGRGFLASVRSVKLHALRLDDVEGHLRVAAARLSGEADHVLYEFNIACDEGELVSGRATVVLDAAGR
jgi:predicted hotdog family 3-hydroxylacyl-ACP dehydratase